MIERLDLNQLRPTTQLIVHTAAETLQRDRGTLRCETSTPFRRPPPNPAGNAIPSESDSDPADPTDDASDPADPADPARRVEDLGPMTLRTVWNWLLHHRITLRPVIDLNQPPPPVDGYEIPDRHRRHLTLRHPTSLFPWSTSRQRLDLDHVQPYRSPAHGGSAGQTGIGNLVPVSRREHRLFTHAGWRRREPDPDTLIVRSPHGHVFLTDATGTHNLGTSHFADTVWDAAQSRSGERQDQADQQDHSDETAQHEPGGNPADPIVITRAQSTPSPAERRFTELVAVLQP